MFDYRLCDTTANYHSIMMINENCMQSGNFQCDVRNVLANLIEMTESRFGVKTRHMKYAFAHSLTYGMFMCH